MQAESVSKLVEIPRQADLAKHAPEVIAAIEKTVRDAAPFPPPARMGKAVWTDTWLWDKSGRFQLDTLTEGQD